MELRHEHFPGVNPLFLSYIRDYPKVSPFYCWDPKADFSPLLRELDGRVSPRQELASMVAAHYPQATDRLKEWVQGQGLAVVTGQQPGLFGGPLYNLYKGLTAIQLARHLERTYSRPVLAFFWVVSEDHDLEEFGHTLVLDKTHRLQRLDWTGEEDREGFPACALTLGHQIKELLLRLEDDLPSSQFKAEVMARLREAYQPEVSFSQAFISWMNRLLGPFGLIMLDASATELKGLAQPIIIKEVNHRVAPLIKEAGESLRQFGFRPQIGIRDKWLNLFHLNGERVKIVAAAGGFRLGPRGRRISKEELVRRVSLRPETFSPNVVLTPLLQSYLLPVLACVAGPSEVCYYAQLKPAFQQFGLVMPVIIPRQSFTLVERRMAQFLNREGLTLRQVISGADAEFRQPLARALPSSLARPLARLKRGCSRGWEEVKGPLAEFDPTLSATLISAQNAVNFHLNKLEEKILKAQKRKEAVLLDKLLLAKSSILPQGIPQERAFSLIPYLVSHGFDLVEKLRQQVQPFDFEHQIYIL